MKTDILNKILILLSFLLVLALVISQLSGNNFRQGAELYAENALEGENLINPEDFNKTGGSVIKIASSVNLADISMSNLYIIDAEESLLNKASIRAIKNLPPPRIIIAANHAAEARAYILLAQKGIKDLYLLDNIEKEMVLNYEFRPDAGNASE
jgi:hypothetical protein